MKNLLSFLQRLYKKYSEPVLRFVVSRMAAFKELGEAAIGEALKRCRQIAKSNSVSKVRNYLTKRIGCSCKQLLAVILSCRIIVKCRKGVLHFIQKISPNIWNGYSRSSIYSGLVMMVSIVIMFALAEWGDLEFALAADNEAVTASSQSDYFEEKIETDGIVVEEEAEQMLGQKFCEVVLQEEQDEDNIVTQTASYKTYALAVSESVLEDTKIEKELPCKKAKVQIKDKDISVMTVNDYNIQIKYGITSEDLKLFERIIEAEAGDQDLKGRILVANVILNRVKSSSFPDSLRGVILQGQGGSAQFSPVSNGSLWRVSVSKKTKEAAKRALDGEDYSEGALYFMARQYASKNSAAWFDRDLTRLFKHGCHEFFK